MVGLDELIRHGREFTHARSFQGFILMVFVLLATLRSIHLFADLSSLCFLELADNQAGNEFLHLSLSQWRETRI